MKKQAISLLLALFGILPAIADIVVINDNLTEAEATATPYTLTINHDKEGKIIEIDFSLNAFYLNDNSECPGTKVCELPGFAIAGQEGMPMLPENVLRYNLPTCDSLIVDLSNVTNTEISCEISPAQISDTGGGEYPFFSTVIDYPGYYPSGICQQSNLQFYRGLPVHYVSITPFSYSCREKKLKVITSFKAIINYNEGVRDLEPNRGLAFNQSRYKEIVKIVYPSVPDFTIWDSLEAATFPEECTEDMLIISSSYFKNTIDSLADWKRQMGYRVHTYLKPEIPYQEMDSVIGNAYNNLENLTNVLIIGAHTKMHGIPYTKLFSQSYIQDHYIGEDAINYSGYAHRDGYNDLLPEFNLGFVYVNNEAELKDFFHKLHKYESEPITDESFYKNTFMAGRFEPEGADVNWRDYTRIPLNTLYQEDQWTTESLELLRPILVDKGLNVKRIYNIHPYMIQHSVWPAAWSIHSELNQNAQKYLNDRMGSFPDYLRYPNFKWAGTKNDIINSFAEGTFLGTYFSHGNSEGWYTLDFFPTDFPQDQLNDKFPLLLSMCCGSGLVSWNHSFANWLMKMRQGAIGVIASTEISLTFATRYLLEGMLKELFPDTYEEGSTYLPELRLGDLLNKGQLYAEQRTNVNRYHKHQRLTFCSYGDPTVAIHTSTPKVYNDPTIVLNDDYVYVDLSEDYNKYPSKLHFYDKSTGIVETFDYVGPNFYFKTNSDEDDILVSITGRNRYPYFGEVKDTNGETSFPEYQGKINGVSFVGSYHEFNLNLWLSSPDKDYTIHYFAIGKHGYITGHTNFNDGDKPFTIILNDDIDGLFELKLVCDGVLLDTYRGFAKDL